MVLYPISYIPPERVRDKGETIHLKDVRDMINAVMHEIASWRKD